MAGINKVILIGRLGSDPEVRYTPSGAAVANFSIATSEEWKDKDTGEKKERTEWHRIVAWRKLGELCVVNAVGRSRDNVSRLGAGRCTISPSLHSPQVPSTQTCFPS